MVPAFSAVRAILLHGRVFLVRTSAMLCPCAEALLKDRRLGEIATPEQLIASFRTREVAEPAL